jgi:hypothetical protein
VAVGLILAVMVGEYLVFARDPGVVAWAVVLSLVAAPFVLITIAARWVNQAARGRGVVGTCGWAVVGLGCVLVFVPVYDVHRWMDRGALPNTPAFIAVGFHLIAGQWVAAVAAVAVGGRAAWAAWVALPEVADYREFDQRKPRASGTHRVFVVLAWVSFAVPLLTAAVCFGLGAVGILTKKAQTVDIYWNVGIGLIAAQAVGVVLAFAALAGIRCRRGVVQIVPVAALGLALNLSCSGGTFILMLLFGREHHIIYV